MAADDAENAGSYIRQVGQFQQALHRAVFAERAVQHREHDIDARIAAGFRQRSASDLHLPSLEMKNSYDLIALRIERGDDRLG